MPYHTYLYLLFVTEIFVVVHLSRDESIGSGPYGSRQQKRASPTAEGNFSDRTSQQLVTLHTLHTETLTQHQYEVIGGNRGSKLTHYSLTALHAAGFLFFTEETKVLQSQLLGYLVVYTALCSIQIGMHRNDGNVILNSLAYSALYIVGI